MRKLCWNVYVENINRRQIEIYNIFDHISFLKDVKEDYLAAKDSFEIFEKSVKRHVAYYFWSKTEREIVLSDWPPSENFQDKKINIYDQVMLNWDIFIKYVWEMLRPIAKSEVLDCA